MGVDMTTFVADRNKAMIAFVENDDWEAVRDYCITYGVDMPSDPNVMAAGIYKAAQEVPSIPDSIKVKAAMKCIKLGFAPYMRPYEPKEEDYD